MSIFKFITKSQLRKVLSALETRFKKIENDVENPPTPDWNQNDSQGKNYIANRVCYVGDSEMNYILSGQILSGEYGFSGNVSDVIEFITQNQQYRVVWDGTVYTGTIGYDTDENSYYIGNGYLFNTTIENTEEPFYILISLYNGSVYAFPEETNSGLNIQFNLYINMPIVHKLDDIYLNGKLVMSGTGDESTILNKSYSSSASGSASVAQGRKTTASGSYSHAEGYDTIASGYGSHAEGYDTTASNYYSHAEGDNTTASGYGSHTEGYGTTASNYYSHAEGNSTTASGSYSHTEGCGTVANHKSQHVFGEYNIEDASTITATSRGTYVEIIGNGTSGSRSNARTLDWSGNEVLAGKLTVGAAPTNNMDVATKQYVDNSLSGFSSNLSGLTDTTISSPANGQALMYDSSASKWKNQTINITSTVEQLTDTIISSPSNGQALIYDSSASKWKNQTINLTSTVTQLTDTAISSPSNGQVLMYNSTTSKWENTSLPVYNGGVAR